jgi:hypothetical protein
VEYVEAVRGHAHGRGKCVADGPMLSRSKTIAAVTSKKKSYQPCALHDARSKCSTGSVESARAAGLVWGECASSVHAPENSETVIEYAVQPDPALPWEPNNPTYMLPASTLHLHGRTHAHTTAPGRHGGSRPSEQSAGEGGGIASTQYGSVTARRYMSIVAL